MCSCCSLRELWKSLALSSFVSRYMFTFSMMEGMSQSVRNVLSGGRYPQNPRPATRHDCSPGRYSELVA